MPDIKIAYVSEKAALGTNNGYCQLAIPLRLFDLDNKNYDF